MYKGLLLSGMLLASSVASADCALEKYKLFVTLQNESLSEALSMMKGKDKENYNRLKNFVAFYHKFNNLNVHIAEQLIGKHDDLLKYDRSVSRFVKDSRRMAQGDQSVFVLDDVLASDKRYQAEMNEVRAKRNYYFYFNADSSSSADIEKTKNFKLAREAFGAYVEKTSQMPELKKMLGKSVSDMCGKKGTVDSK